MSEEAERRDHDVVLLYNRTEDGDGYRALRSRPGKVEMAEVRPLKEGKPILSADVVRLREREGSPLLWDVDVQYSSAQREQGSADREQTASDGERAASDREGAASDREKTGSDRAGPARVSTEEYRNNWERIFRGGTTRAVDPSKLN